MQRATSLDREIVLTHASLLLAAARERGVPLDPHAAAREILAAHPEVHVTEPGLAEVIRGMLSCDELHSTPGVVATGPTELADLGSQCFSREGAEGP